MPVAIATQGLPLGECVGIVTHHSGFSTPTFGEVPEKTTLASAPVIDSVVAPVETAGILVLNISLPTTDTDGNALAQSEIVKIRMHHSTDAGVDIYDDYVDFPPGETLQWGPGDVDTHYVAVRVQDSHDNWSALSNEKSGAANEAASTEPEDAGLWAHRLGGDAIWTEDSPDTNSVAWSNVILYWKNNKYTIADGNTDKKYIWWDYSLSTTTFQVTDVAPSLEQEDVIIGYNDGGVWRLMVYAPMVIADYIRAGVLESANWAVAEGSQFDLANGILLLGGSQAILTLDAMNAKIVAGTGNDIIAIDAGDDNYRLVIGNATYANAPFSVQKDGSFYLGGVTGNLQWSPSPATLLVTATYASAAAGNERISINDTVAHLGALDSSNNVRIDFHSEDITLFDATPTLIAYIPTTTGLTHATNPYFAHNQVTVDNKLVVGSTAIDDPSEALHVTGNQKLTGSLDVDTNLNVDGYIEVGDHSTPTSARAVGIVYGTGSPPAASSTPIGTLWVKYSA